LKSTILAAVVLNATCALAQQADASLSARHVIGLENIKRNASGKLTIQNGVMRLDAGKENGQVPIASIDDITIGSETTQGGGKAGTVAKTAAIAAPYESGAALTVLLRAKVDILTLAYRDPGGGIHGAILALPKGQAETVRGQLVAAGAHSNEPTGQTFERKPPIPAAPRDTNQKLKASAIRIEPVGAGDVQIPAEFRLAIYEFLVQRVRESGTFQKVFRSGDREADSIPDLVTLHTTVQKFQEGSQMKRELTKVLGATTVDVSTTVTGHDGQPLLNNDIQGKVRFFGENLGVTNDIAKRIAKLLAKNY